jgi:hypothetical protein
MIVLSMCDGGVHEQRSGFPVCWKEDSTLSDEGLYLRLPRVGYMISLLKQYVFSDHKLDLVDEIMHRQLYRILQYATILWLPEYSWFWLFCGLEVLSKSCHAKTSMLFTTYIVCAGSKISHVS